MTDNNHGSSSSFENGPSATMESRQPGGLVASHGAPPSVMGSSPFAPPASQDVIHGGIDASTMLHALRRRWPLAIGMGLLAGVLGAGILWWLFPESATAYRYFQVASTSQGILDNAIGVGGTRDFDIYRQTQMVLMKSPRVLDSALRSGALGQLSFFEGVEEKDRTRYLQEELKVQFQQGSEILEVRLSGAATSEELKEIVEAVGKAFLDEVLFEEQIKSKKPRDILAESYQDLDAEIKRKVDAYYALLGDSNSAGIYDQNGDPEIIQLRSEMMELGKHIAKQEAELLAATMQYQKYKMQYEDPAVMDQRIDQALEQDPKYYYLKQRQMQYDMYVMDLQAVQKNGNSAQIRQYQKLSAGVAQQMEQYKQQMTAAMKKQQRTEPDPYIKALNTDMMITRSGLMQQINTGKERQAEILEVLRERFQIDTDQLARESEIEGLKQVQASIAERIQHWDVELKRPERVEAFGGVETSDGINTAQRYAISAIGGLACLGLTAFGFSYLEFRNRKLNGPDQIDQGLGIRVIGSLPSLSGRRSLNPSNVAQLTESIDSVRTALMHESTSRRRQIVMITSPSTLEGRTTVASQLAASLARAGRRTLLIDGDLRHPALHSLFDLPLEDGLCEVLRAEAEVADVVRPTHAEGLWVVTAGYCDSDAIHALATDQVQPIFEKLRSEYDFIIIDGAPVLGLSDSLLFGQHCDGAILSVLRDHTKLPKIHQSAELLRSVGIRLMGSVVNGMPGASDRRITALQSVTAKSERKQLESNEA